MDVSMFFPNLNSMTDLGVQLRHWRAMFYRAWRSAKKMGKTNFDKKNKCRTTHNIPQPTTRKQLWQKDNVTQRIRVTRGARRCSGPPTPTRRQWQTLRCQGARAGPRRPRRAADTSRGASWAATCRAATNSPLKNERRERERAVDFNLK